MQAWAQPDTIAFVDAPLVVTNATGQRPCEKEVGQRYGHAWVSANSTNLGSPRLAGVALRELAERHRWRCDDGLDGPPRAGRWLSECYPYTAIVGTAALGYARRPMYKRKPRSMRVAQFRPLRAAACDELVGRLAALEDPPLRLRSHPLTAELVDTPAPLADREYKHREDLLDAAICAWTALVWSLHGPARCRVLGAGQAHGAPRPAATIIAPARD
jgi:predicted RNase H-like nuclease